MTETQFLDILETELNRREVADVADIREEYAEHFAFKRADGCAEEEIAAKLGDPRQIAAQYGAEPTTSRAGKKALTGIGLGVLDFFFGILCVLLGSFAAVLVALIPAFGALAIALMGNLGRLEGISVPAMPYPCACIFALLFAALTALTVVGTVYYLAFMRQLCRAYGRFHHNTLAAAAQKPLLPPLAIHPQFSSARKQRLRLVALVSLLVFAACFIIGYVACTLSAGSLQFWHVWGWFQ